jgi:hypothetical protein
MARCRPEPIAQYGTTDGMGMADPASSSVVAVQPACGFALDTADFTARTGDVASS